MTLFAEVEVSGSGLGRSRTSPWLGALAMLLVAPLGVCLGNGVNLPAVLGGAR